MAGEARTSAFVLSSATVMLGDPADILEFQPSTHSIGLVKNFTLGSDTTYTELTQGAKNTVVESISTQMQARATMEVYEYTASNLALGLGLEGFSLQEISTNHVLKTAAVGDDATPVTSAEIDTDVTASYTVGDWINIQGPSGATADMVHLAKLSAVATATGTTTLTFAGFPIPDGITFPIGSKIGKVHMIAVGSKDEQPYLGAKIVGILPKGNKPVTIIIPKLRISKGFSLAFRTDNFGNMPFELTPYDLVTTDPKFALWGGLGQAFIYKG